MVSVATLFIAAATQGCSSAPAAAANQDPPDGADTDLDATMKDVATDAGADSTADQSAVDAGVDAEMTVIDAGCPALIDNGCVTKLEAGTLLFGFDNGDVCGWFNDPASAPEGAVNGVVDDGVTCKGALSYTVPFGAYGQRSLVDFNWGISTPLAWYGTTLHFSVKILTTAGGYAGLLIVQPMMLWDDWADSDYTMWQYVNPALADGQWHQVTLPITDGSGEFLQSVNGFRFLVNDMPIGLDGGPIDGGPPSPSGATYLFDDVWIE